MDMFNSYMKLPEGWCQDLVDSQGPNMTIMDVFWGKVCWIDVEKSSLG